jgi:hypothetical protein
MRELNTLSVIYQRPSELFIQQLPPYARVPYPDRDRERERARARTTPAAPVAASLPAVAVAPSPPPPSQTPVPAVADLLDVRFSVHERVHRAQPVSCSQGVRRWPQIASSAPPILRLGPLGKLDAKTFQAYWGALGAGYAPTAWGPVAVARETDAPRITYRQSDHNAGGYPRARAGSRPRARRRGRRSGGRDGVWRQRRCPQVLLLHWGSGPSPSSRRTHMACVAVSFSFLSGARVRRRKRCYC